MRVDNSTLRAVARCTTEALWRYHLDYAPIEEGMPLLVGSAVHSALDMYFKNEGDVKLAIGTLNQEYKDFPSQPPDGDRLTYNNVSAILTQWFAEHPLDRLPWVMDGASFESTFAVEVEDTDITFCGRLDGIVRHRTDGRWYVLEHKTTSRVTSYWTKQFQSSSQITGYIWAGERIKEVPIVGAFINAIELSLLPSDPVRRCATHKTKYAECGALHAKGEILVTQRQPIQVEQWLSDVERLAKRFRVAQTRYPTVDEAIHAPQEGVFHGACTFCGFNNFCMTGRRPELIDSMLVKRPWSVIHGEGD